VLVGDVDLHGRWLVLVPVLLRRELRRLEAVALRQCRGPRINVHVEQVVLRGALDLLDHPLGLLGERVAEVAGVEQKVIHSQPTVHPAAAGSALTASLGAVEAASLASASREKQERHAGLRQVVLARTWTSSLAPAVFAAIRS
jgi:hypothetical protein